MSRHRYERPASLALGPYQALPARIPCSRARIPLLPAYTLLLTPPLHPPSDHSLILPLPTRPRVSMHPTNWRPLPRSPYLTMEASASKHDKPTAPVTVLCLLASLLASQPATFDQHWLRAPPGRRVTVVITSCGRLPGLRRTIASFLAANTYPIDRYLIVEDSVSPYVTANID